MLKRDKAKQLQKLKQESAQFFKSVYKIRKDNGFGEGILMLPGTGGEAPGQQVVQRGRLWAGLAKPDEF